MIFDAIIAVFVGLLKAIAALIPKADVPAWFTSASGTLSDWLGYASSVGVWVPIPLMLTVMSAILVSIVTGFVIRLVRVIASFFTAGGGSAG